MHFHDTDDSAYHRTLRRAAPAMVEAFGAFDEAVFGTTHGEVWSSVDGGTTWHRSRQGLPPVTSVRYAG